jgi:hypothetical protein
MKRAFVDIEPFGLARYLHAPPAQKKLAGFNIGFA